MTDKRSPVLRLVSDHRGDRDLCAEAVPIAFQTIKNAGDADAVRPEHRAALCSRPAVAKGPHHIDIRRPLGNALLQNLGRLVHHGVEGADDDLLVIDLSGLNAGLGPKSLNDRRRD